MRDFDIPSVLKVKNPGPEIFSLAGLFNLAPGKITDIHIGALHDSRRAAAYSSVLNSIAGGAIEYVSGPDNFKLPTSVANAISRREKVDLAGIEDAKRKSEALAARPDGTPTLPVVHPPAQQAVVPQECKPVGSVGDDDFTPPPAPTKQAEAPKAEVAPPAPAPKPAETAPVKGKVKGKPSPDSDPPAQPLSDL